MIAPKFSVIIPLYNSEDYIVETLLSLVNQSDQNFEVIIVDDKSTDSSLKIVAGFLEKYPQLAAKLFTDRPLEFPKGVSGSRSYGISQARGEWISFLDSDDLFHPRKFEILNREIEKINSTSIRAIHHKAVDFTDGDDITFSKNIEDILSVHSDISKELLTRNTICTSTVTIHKDLFSRFKFDYDLHGIEDYYMWLNVSKVTDWMYVSSPLTAYRVRLSSLMGGRKMSYYIIQNSNLIDKIKTNTLFSKKEVAVVRKYLMNDIMHYYAMISINNYGWRDFLRGILLLMRKGQILSGFQLLLKHLRFKFLNIAGAIIKKNK